MKAVPPEARGQFGVFTVRQAVAAGWSSDGLRRAVAGGRLIRLRGGAYWVPPATQRPTTRPDIRPDTSARLRADTVAILLRRSGSIAASAGAAALLGLPFVRVPSRPCVTMTTGTTGGFARAHVHRAYVAPEFRIIGHNLRCTPAAVTVVDLGREFGLEAAVVAADFALHRGLLQRSELDGAVLDRAGRVGIGAVKGLSGCVDPLAESVLETMSRLRLLQAGLPAPQTQVRLTRRGEFLGRVDFYWPQFRVVGEADGLGKYDSNAFALRDEKLRQERLERAGLTVVRWGWADLDDVRALVARLRWAFSRAS